MLNILQELQVCPVPKKPCRRTTAKLGILPQQPLHTAPLAQSNHRAEMSPVAPNRPSRFEHRGAAHPIPKKGKEWPRFGKALFPWHFFPFHSFKAVSATWNSPGVVLQSSLALHIAGSKEEFPGRLAQAWMRHRMAWLRGISGQDQTRRHCPGQQCSEHEPHER